MRRIVLFLAVGAVLAAGAPIASAQGAPTEDTLKATHQVMLQAVNGGNVAMIAALVHPQAVGFFRDSQQLVQLGAGVTAMAVVPTIITDVSRYTATPFSTAFRVIGDVGIVALTSVLAPNPKATEDNQPRYQRSTFVYLHTADGWKLASWHTSQTPLKPK